MLQPTKRFTDVAFEKLEFLINKDTKQVEFQIVPQLLAKHKRHRSGFRAAIYEAISQLEFYRNWFDEKQHRDKFYSRTGLNAYRPRVVLIVGRKLDY